jgi:hypothetical protein
MVIITCEIERVREQAFVAGVNVLFRHLSRETGENYENFSQKSWYVSLNSEL